MTAIDRKERDRLARLSRLSLEAGEAEKFARDLDTVIAHASDLGKADTDNVPPMIGAAEMRNVMRADGETAEGMAFEPSFPETQGGRLKVPKIL